MIYNINLHRKVRPKSNISSVISMLYQKQNVKKKAGKICQQFLMVILAYRDYE